MVTRYKLIRLKEETYLKFMKCKHEWIRHHIRPEDQEKVVPSNDVVSDGIYEYYLRS